MTKDSGPRRLYGRRRGHRLRPGQAHLIDDLLPQLSVPLDKRNLDPHRLFEGVAGVRLEIGFGAGEHLLAQAEAHPDLGFIGCEPFLNGMASLLAELKRRRLSNIRVLMGDARDLLDCLGKNSLDRVYILFPDPWPKKRHAKRRIISPQTLDQLAKVMRPGAHLHVATDIADYCRWTLAHIQRHPAFEWLAERPEDWQVRGQDWPPTRYEAKAIAAGRRPVYLRIGYRAPNSPVGANSLP